MNDPQSRKVVQLTDAKCKRLYDLTRDNEVIFKANLLTAKVCACHRQSTRQRLNIASMVTGQSTGRFGSGPIMPVFIAQY